MTCNLLSHFWDITTHGAVHIYHDNKIQITTVQTPYLVDEVVASLNANCLYALCQNALSRFDHFENVTKSTTMHKVLIVKVKDIYMLTGQ